MAAPNSAKAFLSTSQLRVGVTGFTAGVPDDGTVLGSIGRIEIREPRRFRYIWREEDNNPDGIVWLGGPLIVACEAYNWDSDAVANLIHGGSAGATGPRIDWPSTDIGKVPTPPANMCICPVDNTSTPKPTVVIFKPQVFPDPTSDVGLKMTAYRFMSFRFAICGTPDATGRTGIMANAADIAL